MIGMAKRLRRRHGGPKGLAIDRLSRAVRRGLTLTVITLATAGSPIAGALSAGSSAQPAAPMAAAAPRTAVVEATEVLRLADVIARALATDGRIPAQAAATLSDGRRETLSAARLFVLLARFLGNGYEEGMTPEYAPLPPQTTGPLERAQALPPQQESVIATADLLAQTRATADVAEGTGHLPTAIWVAGLRLTPPQFMGAMATLLQHAAYEGEVPEQVVVGPYLPPAEWGSLGPGPNLAPPTAPPETENQPAAASPSVASAPEAQNEASASVPPVKPQLTLYISAEPKWSGVQVLTIEYQGPPAFVRLSIDGVSKAVSNVAHFTYLWDTRLEADGRHTIQVAAVNQQEEILERAKATVETANGNLPLR